MKAYYFHGINTSGKSRKAELLSTFFYDYYIDLHEITYNLERKDEYDIVKIIQESKSFILETSIPGERVILIGSSFGCYVINRLINELEKVKFFKIVFLAPLLDIKNIQFVENFETIENKIKIELKIDGKNILIIDDASSITNDVRGEIPLLIIHGKSDNVVNYKLSEKYRDKVREDIINSGIILILVDSNHRLTENFESVKTEMKQENKKELPILEQVDNFLFGYREFRMLVFDNNNKLSDLWQGNILHVLKSSYGRKYFGDEYHLQKFKRSNISYFLVFNKTRKLIACSYTEEDGKHIAMGVLPFYRNRGIAKHLFKFSFQIFESQYAEVESHEMYTVLRQVGFVELNDIAKVKKMLGPVKSKMIDRHYIQNDILYYYRRSTIIGKNFKFKLMIKNK